MKTEELINFYTICEYQSFNKAATALYLSRQALLRSIDSLENQLHKKLFSRSSTGVELTEFGRLFYEEAKPVLEGQKRLLALPEEYDRRSRNHFTLGLRGSFGSAYTIRKIIAEYEAAHPNISIEILSLENHEIEMMIRDEKVDFAYSILPVTLPGISGEIMTEIEMCLVVSKSHPFAKVEKVTPDMLDQSKYMVCSFSHHTARIFRSYAAEYGKDVDIVFTTPDLNLVYTTAMTEGLAGVTIKRDAWMGEALFDDIVVKSCDPPLQLIQGLLYKSKRKYTKEQRNFMDFFKRSFSNAYYVTTKKDKQESGE